jgi:RNA polymerase sigma-70 factor (ECF subfamily)
MAHGGDNYGREGRWAAAMLAARGGDAEAYARLLAEIATALRAFAATALQRTGLERHDVEDVVQETLLALHVKRHTWDPSRPFLPWLRAIARHKAIDIVRRRGARAELPLEDFAETLIAPAAEPARGVQVERFLAALPPRQREVVTALAVDGASVADTARRFNLSRGAVYVALHRGLAALAVMFGDWGA